jgi:hypothetical protein
MRGVANHKISAEAKGEQINVLHELQKLAKKLVIQDNEEAAAAEISFFDDTFAQ